MTKNLRALLFSLLALFTLTATAACGARGGSDTNAPLTIMADSTPHAAILKHIQESGALGDVKIEVRELTGGVDANQLLASGDIDANFFQHTPYLTDWSKQKGNSDLVSVARTHIEPLGLYSKKVTKLDDLAAGSTIAIAADPTNQGRGLFLLQANGLIELNVKDGDANIDFSQIGPKSITKNPKNFTFVQIDRPQLPATLDDAKVALSVINGAQALEAGLTPAKDAIVLEKPDNNPYVNILVVKSDKKDDPRVKKVSEALTSPEVASWIKTTYNGSVLPAGK